MIRDQNDLFDYALVWGDMKTLLVITSCLFVISTLLPSSASLAGQKVWKISNAKGKEIPKNEFDKIIAQHEEWISTRGEKGKKFNFDGLRFNNVDFRHFNVSEMEFNKAVFSNCTFAGNYLRKVRMRDCRFLSCNFSNTIIDEAHINKSIFLRTNFFNSMIGESLFSDTSFIECNMSKWAYRDNPCSGVIRGGPFPISL